MATHKGVAWYHSGTPDSEQVSILEPPDSMILVRFKFEEIKTTLII